MRFLFNFFLAIASGVLYRMGGSQYYQTIIRDAGVPATMLIALWPHDLAMWIGAVLTFGATWGFLTMGYGGEGEPKEDQSDLYKIFGKNVFFALGFLYGIGALPWAIATGRWGGFILRTIALTFLIPLIAKYARPVWKWDRAQVEEWSRGFVINMSCVLL